MMWFKCEDTGRMFGILVPHGGVVILSKYAAGMTSNIKHKVTGGENSWYIACQFKVDTSETA